MTDTTLYDTDFVAWTEEQAAALRTLAQQPDLTNAVDWGNIIEEIECLGRSEARGVESQLVNALAHILKGFCDPGSLSRLAWAIETGNFLQQARKDFRKSMRDKLNIDEIWREAFQSASRELLAYKRRVPPGIPETSPFTLDEVLADSFAYEPAVRRLYELLDARH
jgi:hypothetical protein